MFFGEVRSKELLPCMICGKRFSVDDVATEKYFASTFICAGCYLEMQAKPFAESCFGKASKKGSGLVQYGYNSKSIVCTEICPDRTICKVFVGRLG